MHWSFFHKFCYDALDRKPARQRIVMWLMDVEFPTLQTGKKQTLSCGNSKLSNTERDLAGKKVSDESEWDYGLQTDAMRKIYSWAATLRKLSPHLVKSITQFLPPKSMHVFFLKLLAPTLPREAAKFSFSSYSNSVMFSASPLASMHSMNQPFLVATRHPACFMHIIHVW